MDEEVYGEFGLVDQRGKREEYVDRDRYIRKLKVENVALKKGLRNLDKEGKELKFQTVDELKQFYSIQELCSALGISKSGYYKYLQRNMRPDKDKDLKKIIQSIYVKRNTAYGYRRIQWELQRKGLTVNHKRV